MPPRRGDGTGIGDVDGMGDLAEVLEKPLPSPGLPLVLVVDDERYNREGYAELLAMFGFRVEQAQDGREAIARAFELLPDAILMDLSLPVVDGWEATRQLKASELTRHIPIVAITGQWLDADARKRARLIGYAGLLQKPCAPNVLEMEIRLALRAIRK
jgi:CheY-like chemotaxis protein